MSEEHFAGDEHTPAAPVLQTGLQTRVPQKRDISEEVVHSVPSQEGTVEQAAMSSPPKQTAPPQHADSDDVAAASGDGPSTHVENPGVSAADTPAEVHPEDGTDQPGEAANAVSAMQMNEAVLAESRKRTRRSFLVGGAAAAGAYGFYHWLETGPQNNDLPALLDRTYDVNAQVSRVVLDQHALAPTYPLSRAETLRVNGVAGLKKVLRLESYRLQVVGVKNAVNHPRFVPDVTAWNYAYEEDASHEDQGHDTKVDPAKLTATKQNHEDDQEEDELHTGRKPRGEEEAGESFSTLRPGTPGLLLELNDFLPRLQRHELVTQFKCIEGWSQIVHWAGVRLADFLELFPPALIDGKEPKYVYMETPDGDYYNGYDLAVCRHPQTLLVTEMMGAPLTQFHGAPLRIHMPTKYGYKQIKRIGLIAYTNEKPDDYWTELGYDWYGGL